jgi:outer membrane protein assembly factor BamB
MTQTPTNTTPAPDPNRTRYRAALVAAAVAAIFCAVVAGLMVRAYNHAQTIEIHKAADLDKLRAEMLKPPEPPKVKPSGTANTPAPTRGSAQATVTATATIAEAPKATSTAAIASTTATAPPTETLKVTSADTAKTVPTEADKELARVAALKNQLRDRDLQLRHDYFYRQWFSNRGGYLLFIGAIVFVVAANRAAAWRPRRKVVRPAPAPDAEVRASALARWTVIAVAILAAGAIVLLTSRLGSTPLDEKVDTGTTLASAVPATPYPTDEEIRKQWPRFRGPFGLATATFTNAPTDWNGPAGKNILWKVNSALPGENSPVVWGDRVYFTGATAEKREVYCLSLADGKTLWTQSVVTPGDATSDPPEVMEDAGFASSSAATDGRYVAAIFANGDFACFDADGKPLWAINLGPFKTNGYGYGTSLMFYRNTIIAQIDQGAGTKTNSFMYAFDVLTGKTAWKTSRPVPASWATPILINTGQREELVACGRPWLISYDPGTGKEFWRAKVLDGDVVPSPVFAGGMILIANAQAKATAIKPGGAGDVTESAVVWAAEGGMPDIVSPVSDGKIMIRATTEGMLTCASTATGTTLWEKETEKQFKSSPTVVGDKIYLMDLKGVMYILAASDKEYKEIGKAELGQDCFASPAFLDGKILIRGRQHLFLIGEKK